MPYVRRDDEQNDNRVIVVGAGPVGAVTTLALVKKGIPVTLIEQLPDAAEDQRAATVHPPTVEMLVELGLEKEVFSDERVRRHVGAAVPFPRPRHRRTASPCSTSAC